jgi:hypothetical protein
VHLSWEAAAGARSPGTAAPATALRAAEQGAVCSATRVMRYILRRPRAFWISVCNLVGLAFSMVGVVMLFWYALPELPPGGAASLAVSGPTPGWEAEVQRYHRLAYVGLVLVLIGTLLEAVPPFSTALGSWRRRLPIAATSRSTGERSTMWAPPHLEGATPVSTNWLSIVTAIGAVIISGISIYLAYKLLLAGSVAPGLLFFAFGAAIGSCVIYRIIWRGSTPS